MMIGAIDRGPACKKSWTRSDAPEEVCVIPAGAVFRRSVTEAQASGNDVEWARRLAFAKKLNAMQPAFLLGRYRNPHRDGEPVYLYDASDGFIGLYYPTRTGKGISFVVPNGFVWPHSMFYSDPKIETIKLIGAYRRYCLGNRVFVVNPNSRAPYISKYNFLDEIRVATFYEIPDTYNLWTALVDPDGTGFRDAKEAIWKRRARDLGCCFTLHVLYAREFREKSLATVIDFLSDSSTPFDAKLKHMKQYQHDPDGRFGWKDVYGRLMRTHPYIAAKLQEQDDRTPQEAMTVLGEVRSYLSYFQSPTVRENSSRSDFSMRDLMDGVVPSTLSLAMTPDELEAAQPYLRLFLNLAINRNLTDIEPDPLTLKMKPAHLWANGLILDEFTVFGRLDIFAKQQAFIAGYRWKTATVVQDHAQIKGDYGTFENITSNQSTMLYSRMNNSDSAKFFSEKTGMRTIGQYGSSEAISVGMNAGVSYSTNYSTIGRPLIRPEELEAMSNEFAWLKQSGRPPLLIEKTPYFEEDSRFAHLVATFQDERGDVIPREEQQSQVNIRELQAEYLDWCRRNSGIDRRVIEEEEKAEQFQERVCDQRERYIAQARANNAFAFAS